jgi:hypothetical protein
MKASLAKNSTNQQNKQTNKSTIQQVLLMVKIFLTFSLFFFISLVFFFQFFHVAKNGDYLRSFSQIKQQADHGVMDLGFFFSIL